MIGRVTRCRTCRQPIVWAVTVNGRRMPVDAEPGDGNLDLVVAAGQLVARVIPPSRLDARRLEPEPRYTSHFATCPEPTRANVVELRAAP